MRLDCRLLANAFNRNCHPRSRSFSLVHVSLDDQWAGHGLLPPERHFVAVAGEVELAARAPVDVEIRPKIGLPDAVWLPEMAGRDPFVHLALLLSATRTLIGATGIANIWARDAVTASGAAKGLTEAFPERMLLGLGVSHQNLVSELRGEHVEVGW